MRYKNPGSTNLILFVSDIDKVFAKLKEANASISTIGGQPVPSNVGRAINAQDPDDFFVGLSQRTMLPADTAPATSNILGELLESIVVNLEETVRTYNDVLGFKFRAPGKFIASTAANIEQIASSALRGLPEHHNFAARSPAFMGGPWIRSQKLLKPLHRLR
jgi:hypothetical protein